MKTLIVCLCLAVMVAFGLDLKIVSLQYKLNTAQIEATDNYKHFAQREERLRVQMDVWQTKAGSCTERLQTKLNEEELMNLGLEEYTLEELVEAMVVEPLPIRVIVQ